MKPFNNFAGNFAVLSKFDNAQQHFIAEHCVVVMCSANSEVRNLTGGKDGTVAIGTFALSNQICNF